MEINVAKISKIEGVKEYFGIQDIQDREIQFYGEVHRVIPPIIVKGSAVNYEGKIEVELSIASKVETVCSRCMERYIQEINTDSQFTFVKDSVTGNDDYYVYKGDSIDITDLVLGEIAAELPMKPLCNTHCKGLCPKCGKNKNITNCQCKNDDIDSRLQILSKLLDEEQGGV